MATEGSPYKVLPTLTNLNYKETNADCSNNANIESGTLLVRPWTTIPAALSEDMDRDSEVRNLLNADHQNNGCCSYLDGRSTVPNNQHKSHRLSPTLSSTSSYNNDDDDVDSATSLNFPKRPGYFLQSNYSLSPSSTSSSPKIVHGKRRHRICSRFHGRGNSLLAALFLLSCAFLLTFFLGLLIGYYMNVGEKMDHPHQGKQGPSSSASIIGDNSDKEEEDLISSADKNCYESYGFPLGCKPNPRLDSVHGNIMYYVNGDRMTDYISKFPVLSAQQTGEEWDSEMTEHLRQEFTVHGLDKVEVFCYNVVTSSPDFDSPTQLELVDSGGQVRLSVPFKSSTTEERGNKSKQFHSIYYSQSVENILTASLFFANYGTSADFEHLKNLHANFTGQIILLRTGKLSIQEKIINAQQEGVRGILLYSDLDGNTNQSTTDESQNNPDTFFIFPYTKGHLHEKFDSISNNKPIPYVYNISSSLANRILSILEETIPKNHSDLINVTLKFSSILKSVTVSNVVGTLYGINQPDEQVFVGSRRLYGSTDKMNSSPIGQSGTAMLLELLHSLSHVRDIEDWHPQRTIKFFSWGTATGNDNAGIEEYLKKNVWIVNSRNVGYVELQDSIGTSCNHLFIRADSASLETIVRAAEMVPDPVNPESSISMRYKYTKSERPMSATSDAAPGSLSSQLVDTHTLQMSHWVPTAQFSCVYSAQNEQPEKFESSDRSHHYRHHMAVTRVASLVLLALADKERHAYSVEQLISAVQHEVSRFLNRCHGVSFKSVDKAMSSLLEIMVGSQHSKIWQGLTQSSSANQNLYWFIHNCQNQLLLLHRILAPLTRLNSSAIFLESLQLEQISLHPNSTKMPLSGIRCSSPVLTAIAQRLEQAFNSLSD